MQIRSEAVRQLNCGLVRRGILQAFPENDTEPSSPKLRNGEYDRRSLYVAIQGNALSRSTLQDSPDDWPTPRRARVSNIQGLVEMSLVSCGSGRQHPGTIASCDPSKRGHSSSRGVQCVPPDDHGRKLVPGGRHGGALTLCAHPSTGSYSPLECAGIAIAARIPTIPTTWSNSIRVKPPDGERCITSPLDLRHARRGVKP